MKYKTTKKEVMNGYNNIICIGYCNAQYLLRHRDPVAYISNRDGWRADIYNLPGNNAISTGYGPFGNIRPPYETIEKYENEARKIACDYSIPYEKQKSKTEKLLSDFIKTVLEV